MLSAARQANRSSENRRMKDYLTFFRESYHRALESPEEITGHLNKFLSDDLDAEAMAGVVDKGLYRQRKKG